MLLIRLLVRGLGGCGRRVLGEVGHSGVVWGFGGASIGGGTAIVGCCVAWFTCLGVVLVWWPGLGLGQQAGRQRASGMNPRKGIRMFDLHAAEAQVREAAEAVRTIVGLPVTQVDVHQVLQVEENVATRVVITGRYTKDVFVSGAVFGYGNPVLVGRQVDRVEESSVFAGGAFYWSVKAFDAQGDLVFEISGEGVDWEVRSR